MSSFFDEFKRTVTAGVVYVLQGEEAEQKFLQSVEKPHETVVASYTPETRVYRAPVTNEPVPRVRTEAPRHDPDGTINEAKLTKHRDAYQRLTIVKSRCLQNHLVMERNLDSLEKSMRRLLIECNELTRMQKFLSGGIEYFKRNPNKELEIPRGIDLRRITNPYSETTALRSDGGKKRMIRIGDCQQYFRIISSHLKRITGQITSLQRDRKKQKVACHASAAKLEKVSRMIASIEDVVNSVELVNVMKDVVAIQNDLGSSLKLTSVENTVNQFEELSQQQEDVNHAINSILNPVGEYDLEAEIDLDSLMGEFGIGGEEFNGLPPSSIIQSDGAPQEEERDFISERDLLDESDRAMNRSVYRDNQSILDQHVSERRGRAMFGHF